MDSKAWPELCRTLRLQLKPHGYCGHLMKYFEPKKQHLREMVERTAIMGESNSVLIIGPRGSGKSALLECVIEDIFSQKSIKDNMFQVMLDGLIHVNDNLALEDITRQLKMTEDKALGSFSEKLRLLLSALKSGNKESKSILFVLDNFDLFCGHKNQTLLYNLFDVAQSRQSPICVVGMSCRPDVLQVLENRVNSRFSHQKILLYDEMTLDEYIEAARNILSLKDFTNVKFQKKWNSEVGLVLKNTSVQHILECRFNYSNTIRDLKELLFLAVLNFQNSKKLSVEDFEMAHKHCMVDSKAVLIQGLSILELSLVIAMVHLTEIYDGEPFNFEMVFNETIKFFKKKMMWNLEKAVVMKAFERLLDLEIVKACTESSANILKRYMLVRLLVDGNQVRDAVANYQSLPVPIKYWIESSIVC
ncbi:origin recognition complex subunit 4-like [Uloborus diversus]|uniref:origin recognition complex subunit 4-like n=1 Tax=Uloborus diversus TaxID=327109 RepID=UPI0024096B74|nr:origin recognition complex subunit 4-like [Uloborus diversus]XP_054720234.1 origin recognition complex subunit 4-like [Uloborus diversus]